jgi:hypothetical protein
MQITKRGAILAALGALALAWSMSGAARAEGPAGGPVPTVLRGVTLTDQVEGRSTMTLSAKLSAEDGTPSRGEPVVFSEISTVFGERLMTLGSAMTDATGTAALPYEPTWGGEHTVVVRYGGGSEYTPAQTTFRFNSVAPPHLHENAKFGLATPRQFAPLGAGLAVLAVWGILGLVVLRTVLGISAAEPATAPATTARTGQPSLRPASLSPMLAALIALTAVALFVGLLLPRARGSEASLVAPVGSFDGGDAQPADGPFAARLVQTIPAFTTDQEGHIMPDSPDLPADLAVVDGRVFVLDTNKGRVLTVTADGKLARTFESDPGGPTSILRALSMTTHGGEIYVAAPLFGNVIELSPAGLVDKVIPVQAPKAARPFHPAGIAVTDSGAIWLSDSSNQRVVLLSASGVFLAAIGQHAVTSSSERLATPSGIALDGHGNLWVVDTGTHEVKEYSPQGTFVSAIGRDDLAMPQDVAIDEQGRVFVSDEALREVRVFGAAGAFLGSIGGPDAAGNGLPESGLQYPYGVEIVGDRLYVMDRLMGMFVFQLGAP